MYCILVFSKKNLSTIDLLNVNTNEPIEYKMIHQLLEKDNQVDDENLAKNIAAKWLMMFKFAYDFDSFKIINVEEEFEKFNKIKKG